MPIKVLRQYIEQQNRPGLTGSDPVAITTSLRVGALTALFGSAIAS